MGRRTAEELDGIPLRLVYIAGNVVEAERTERTLTTHDIDYVLGLEPFTTTSMVGAIFSGIYAGVFFLVSSDQHSHCRELLRAQGLMNTVELNESVAQGEH
ncbi:MAG: hypothetical protein ACKOBZ_09140 [Nitrospira sp.]